MLRVGVAIVVLAGCVAATALDGAMVAAQSLKLVIKGSIAYEANGALPPDSRAVVELRHIPALPKAPAVAEQRVDLEQKGAPVPFEFAVERYRLVGGITYVVRVAIFSGTRAIWT